METSWCELPEINRKIALNSSYTSYGGSLGCHCGTISGVSATFGSGYYAACDGKNIQVLDTKKEPPIQFTQNYNGYYSAPNKEMELVTSYLKENKPKIVYMLASVYPNIVDKCMGVPLWVMSDVINYEAPAREPRVTAEYIYEVFGYTRDFAKYLIDNKIGYVLASPIVQNPTHRSAKNYSLNQAWFWIPPLHLSRAIDVAEAYYGSDPFPGQEEWVKMIGQDINLKDPTTILQQVLSNGVFPEEKRFHRSASGRFEKVINAA